MTISQMLIYKQYFYTFKLSIEHVKSTKKKLTVENISPLVKLFVERVNTLYNEEMIKTTDIPAIIADIVHNQGV